MACGFISSLTERYGREKVIAALLISGILIWLLADKLLFGNWGDVENYYFNISQVIDDHLMPYSQTKFEYPPLSLLFFAIPKLLSWDKLSFEVFYLIECAVFLFIGYHFIFKISKKFPMSKKRTLFIMVSLIIFAYNFIMTRNDVFPTTLLIIALWFYLDKKYVCASVMLALAAMTKIYPAFLIFALVIPFFVKNDWKNLLKTAGAFAAVCLLAELPFLIFDSSTAFAYLTYHSDRGIQIESVIGSILLFINIFVPDFVTISSSYGSENLTGSVPDLIAPYMDYILAAVLVIFTVLAVYLIRKGGADHDKVRKNTACIAVVAVLMLFITFSKVYSAQYMIWIFMILPLALLLEYPQDKCRKIMVLYILFGLFSFINGSITYRYLNHDFVPSVLVDLIKNILHIVLMAYLMHMLFVITRKDPEISE